MAIVVSGTRMDCIRAMGFVKLEYIKGCAVRLILIAASLPSENPFGKDATQPEVAVVLSQLNWILSVKLLHKVSTAIVVMPVHVQLPTQA